MFTATPRTSVTGPPPKLAIMSEEGDVSARRASLISVQVEGNLRNLAIIDTGEHIVMCCQYHKNGQLLAVGLSDGVIKIYDPDTMTLLYTLSDSDSHHKQLAVTNIRFLPTLTKTSDANRNLLMATHASGLVKLWHYTSQKVVFTMDETRTTLCGSFNPDGSKFVTSGSDSIIRIYDTTTRKQLRTCERSDARDKMNGHSWSIYAVKYHESHPRMFLTGGWDNTIQFWDDREKHAVRKIFGPHICGDAVDIDPVNDHVLTGSWRKDTPLQIWDFSSCKLLAEVSSGATHACMLYTAQFHGRDYMLAGGCEENMAKVIDRGTLNTVGQILNLDQGVYSVDNTRQGANPKFAVTSGSTVYILQLSRI